MIGAALRCWVGEQRDREDGDDERDGRDRPCTDAATPAGALPRSPGCAGGGPASCGAALELALERERRGTDGVARRRARLADQGVARRDLKPLVVSIDDTDRPGGHLGGRGRIRPRQQLGEEDVGLVAHISSSISPR